MKYAQKMDYMQWTWKSRSKTEKKKVKSTTENEKSRLNTMKIWASAFIFMQMWVCMHT